MREEINNWFKQSLADLKTAKDIIKTDNYYASVFFCHQSVEKGLNALSLKLHRKTFNTHNLVVFGKRVDIPEKYLSWLRELNPSYIVTRYPDAANGIPAEMYDKDIAEKHSKYAEEIIQWIKKQIQK